MQYEWGGDTFRGMPPLSALPANGQCPGYLNPASDCLLGMLLLRYGLHISAGDDVSAGAEEIAYDDITCVYGCLHFHVC